VNIFLFPIEPLPGVHIPTTAPLNKTAIHPAALSLSFVSLLRGAEPMADGWWSQIAASRKNSWALYEQGPNKIWANVEVPNKGAAKVQCRWRKRKKGGPGPALMFFPASGYITFFCPGRSPYYSETRQACASLEQLEALEEFSILVVEYPNWMDHKATYPAGLDAAWAALQWLLMQPSVRKDSVSLMGSSSGGHVALTLAIRARRQGIALSSIAVDGPGINYVALSREALLAVDPELRTTFGYWLAVPAEAQRDPLVCPLAASSAELAQLPPTYLGCYAQDAYMLSEHMARASAALATKMARAGVKLHVSYHEDAVHSAAWLAGTDQHRLDAAKEMASWVAACSAGKDPTQGLEPSPLLTPSAGRVLCELPPRTLSWQIQCLIGSTSDWMASGGWDYARPRLERIFTGRFFCNEPPMYCGCLRSSSYIDLVPADTWSFLLEQEGHPGDGACASITASPTTLESSRPGSSTVATNATALSDQVDVKLSFRELLGQAQAEHLLDVVGGGQHGEVNDWADELLAADGRRSLMDHLKNEAGISKLPERQRIVNALCKALRAQGHSPQ
jgi:acetyl esterase/lipase